MAQTIKIADLKRIREVACEGWQTKIDNYIQTKTRKGDKTITFKDWEVFNIIDASRDNQIGVVLSVFKGFQENNITTRVNFYKDACRELNKEPLNEDDLRSKGFTNREITGRKLETIAEAFNEGEKVDIYNSSIARHYPYFWTNGAPSGFSFHDSLCDYSLAFAGSGSRLCYLAKSMSNCSGKKFIDLWREFIQ